MNFGDAVSDESLQSFSEVRRAMLEQLWSPSKPCFFAEEVPKLEEKILHPLRVWLQDGRHKVLIEADLQFWPARLCILRQPGCLVPFLCHHHVSCILVLNTLSRICGWTNGIALLMLVVSRELCALFVSVTKWTTSFSKKSIQRRGRLEVAHPNPVPLSSIVAGGTWELWLQELAIPLSQRHWGFRFVFEESSNGRVEKVKASSFGNQRFPSVLIENVGSCKKMLSASSHIVSSFCCRTVTLLEVHFLKSIPNEARVAVRSFCSLQASSGVLVPVRRSSMYKSRLIVRCKNESLLRLPTSWRAHVAWKALETTPYKTLVIRYCFTGCSLLGRQRILWKSLSSSFKHTCQFMLAMSAPRFIRCVLNLSKIEKRLSWIDGRTRRKSFSWCVKHDVGLSCCAFLCIMLVRQVETFASFLFQSFNRYWLEVFHFNHFVNELLVLLF